MNQNFWVKLNTLLKVSETVIDRPKGTTHSRYPEIVFPLDYGYLKNTPGGDGNEIDIWKGSLKAGNLVAIACTVDILKRDTEIKLIVDCNNDEIQIIKEFYNNKYMSAIIIGKKETVS